MMTKRTVIFSALAGANLLMGSMLAQETNVCAPLPATKLEGFETNVDTVIIKASAPIGSVPAHGGTVAVRCREITDAGTGHRESGVMIDIASAGPVEDSVSIDYDELDSLLDGLDYLSKLDWTVTPLPSFSATYTTKGGFRTAAFGSRRTGNIEFSIRSTRVLRSPLLLSRDQLAQLRSLVEQGKAKLDSLRKEK
jgi:hypothetical protein